MSAPYPRSAQGKIVAIPTEALYLLIADPMNLHAITRVFQAKGRETVRSLPMLVSDTLMVEELVREMSMRFYLLARRFWPGPLSIIMPASSKVPLKVTGNTGRIAIRQSRSKVAKEIIERINQPVIRDQRQHLRPAHLHERHRRVREHGRARGPGAGRRVPAAARGPSTVDITEPYWKMIREGAIPEQEIADCLQGT